MLFTKEFVQNSRLAKKQWESVIEARDAANSNTLALNHMAGLKGLKVNDGLIPRDVYQEFDNVTVERMRSDDGDTFINDLLPMSKPVSIGRLIHRFRQASDAGQTQTSMTGQIGVKMDQVEFAYDGTLVPVHDTGFFRNWREFNAQQAEAFDALIDDQRESVAALRRRAADNFLDGHTDKDGNVIVVDGLSWEGMRNDSRVAAIDLGASGINFDFTDNANTGVQIKAAFIQVRDVMWITNTCERPLVYYVSREIMSNWERKFSANYESPIISQELARLMGVEDIKVSSKLTGNEMMGFPLDGNSVRPIVGMGINTVAMPRPHYNSNYEFVVWDAVGFEVRTDFFGKTCAFFAQELT